MPENQTTQERQFPQYVTDGFHIYLWNEEYIKLLDDGKLKPSDPPQPKKVDKMTARQRTKLEAARKKALEDAKQAVALFEAPVAPVTQNKFEDVFGAEPRSE